MSDASRTEPSSPRGAITRLARRMAWATLAAAATGGLAFIVGFLWFVDRVPREEVVLRDKADGIVALTGGALRVMDAVELLAAGHGQRLLITGVYRATHPAELARRAPEYQRLFACCIDLDYAAVNTIGNAVQARRWTVSRGFRSLVVVTSSYHMPRAMAELSHQLPGVKLVAYPVVTGKGAEPWWSNPAHTKLLVFEYMKYIAAVVRMRIEPSNDVTRTSAALACPPDCPP